MLYICTYVVYVQFVAPTRFPPFAALYAAVGWSVFIVCTLHLFSHGTADPSLTDGTSKVAAGCSHPTIMTVQRVVLAVYTVLQV